MEILAVEVGAVLTERLAVIGSEHDDACVRVCPELSSALQQQAHSLVDRLDLLQVEGVDHLQLVRPQLGHDVAQLVNPFAGRLRCPSPI